MKELAQLNLSRLPPLRAVLTDIDDTLTLDGLLPAEAYAALEKLVAAGIAVVPVTGRPAGWCDMIARFWPVAAVVGENGAFAFSYDRIARKMHREYAQSADVRQANTARLRSIVQDVLQHFPGAAIASDQAYREIDVAIDFCEDVPPLPLDVAQSIAEVFAAKGATAKVSSIHVNAWFGDHDKLSMSLRVLEKHFGLSPAQAKLAVVYCGDSPNDAPMFEFFPLSFGMANIKPLAHLVSHLPTYVTQGEGGQGFVEVADLLLHSRSA